MATVLWAEDDSWVIVCVCTCVYYLQITDKLLELETWKLQPENVD